MVKLDDRGFSDVKGVSFRLFYLARYVSKSGSAFMHFIKELIRIRSVELCFTMLK